MTKQPQTEIRYAYQNISLGVSISQDVPTTILCGILALVTLLTIFGNSMVMSAIMYGNFLRKPQFLLIFSLACTDLLLGILVLPFSISVEIYHGSWILGSTLCEFWIAVDVLCCTASIWHLVVIALDRFRATKSANYARHRPQKLIQFQILLIWLTALVVAVSPLLGWKDEGFEERVLEGVCLISQDVLYQFFSTMTAFFIPLGLISFLYYKILNEARSRISMHIENRPDRFSTFNSTYTDSATMPKFESLDAGDTVAAETIATFGIGACSEATVKTALLAKVSTTKAAVISSSSPSERSVVVPVSAIRRPSWQDQDYQTADEVAETQNSVGRESIVDELQRRKIRAAVRRERRATRTLAILTGTFIVCWFPFFILALIRPVCSCVFPRMIDSTTLWLGYVNSTLNPIVYTIFSPDFRATFKKMWKQFRRTY